VKKLSKQQKVYILIFALAILMYMVGPTP